MIKKRRKGEDEITKLEKKIPEPIAKNIEYYCRSLSTRECGSHPLIVTGSRPGSGPGSWIGLFMIGPLLTLV